MKTFDNFVADLADMFNEPEQPFRADRDIHSIYQGPEDYGHRLHTAMRYWSFKEG